MDLAPLDSWSVKVHATLDPRTAPPPPTCRSNPARPNSPPPPPHTLTHTNPLSSLRVNPLSSFRLPTHSRRQTPSPHFACPHTHADKPPLLISLAHTLTQTNPISSLRVTPLSFLRLTCSAGPPLAADAAAEAFVRERVVVAEALARDAAASVCAAVARLDAALAEPETSSSVIDIIGKDLVAAYDNLAAARKLQITAMEALPRYSGEATGLQRVGVPYGLQQAGGRVWICAHIYRQALE